MRVVQHSQPPPNSAPSALPSSRYSYSPDFAAALLRHLTADPSPSLFDFKTASERELARLRHLKVQEGLMHQPLDNELSILLLLKFLPVQQHTSLAPGRPLSSSVHSTPRSDLQRSVERVLRLQHVSSTERMPELEMLSVGLQHADLTEGQRLLLQRLIELLQRLYHRIDELNHSHSAKTQQISRVKDDIRSVSASMELYQDQLRLGSGSGPYPTLVFEERLRSEVLGYEMSDLRGNVQRLAEQARLGSQMGSSRLIGVGELNESQERSLMREDKGSIMQGIAQIKELLLSGGGFHHNTATHVQSHSKELMSVKETTIVGLNAELQHMQESTNSIIAEKEAVISGLRTELARLENRYEQSHQQKLNLGEKLKATVMKIEKKQREDERVYREELQRKQQQITSIETRQAMHNKSQEGLGVDSHFHSQLGRHLERFNGQNTRLSELIDRIMGQLTVMRQGSGQSNTIARQDEIGAFKAEQSEIVSGMGRIDGKITQVGATLSTIVGMLGRIGSANDSEGQYIDRMRQSALKEAQLRDQLEGKLSQVATCADEEYYLNKIRCLQEALGSVGAQLNDAKDMLSLALVNQVKSQDGDTLSQRQSTQLQ